MIDFAKLTEPFKASEIEWRAAQAGKGQRGFWVKLLAYITNRAIMDRLDAVCGHDGWRNEFREWTSGTEKGVLCGISLKIGEEWITKWDGAENTNIDGVKGGLSSAMKRAAVQWGIGRYLYGLDEFWGDVKDKGAIRAQTKDKEWFSFDPPQLPAWALPKGEAKATEPAKPAAASTQVQTGAKAPAKTEEQRIREGKKYVTDLIYKIAELSKASPQYVREMMMSALKLDARCKVDDLALNDLTRAAKLLQEEEKKIAQDIERMKLKEAAGNGS